MTSATFTVTLHICILISANFILQTNCGPGKNATNSGQPKPGKEAANTKVRGSSDNPAIHDWVNGNSNESDPQDQTKTNHNSWAWPVVETLLAVALVLSLCANLYQLGTNDDDHSGLETVYVDNTPRDVPILERTKPFQKEFYMVSKDSFTIDETSLLRPPGSSSGMVCTGTVTKDGSVEESVNVKVVEKRHACKGLLHEIKMLSYLGKHPHIVELIGAYTEELEEGRVLLFLQLCELGTLQSYLREAKSQIPEGDTDGEKGELDGILISDMGRWSREIATAMEYISSKYVVLCDISTRKVLLTADKQAKLFDFSLSRRPFEDQSGYGIPESGALRRRSLAPESLQRYEFTDKSDVWSFGIFLWEIYTLGDEPGLNWAVDFPVKVEKGLRLRKPNYNIDNMYSVMLRCWKLNPGRRPTFSELVNILGGNLPRADADADEMVDNDMSMNHARPVLIDGDGDEITATAAV